MTLSSLCFLHSHSSFGVLTCMEPAMLIWIVCPHCAAYNTQKLEAAHVPETQSSTAMEGAQ